MFGGKLLGGVPPVECLFIGAGTVASCGKIWQLA